MVERGRKEMRKNETRFNMCVSQAVKTNRGPTCNHLELVVVSSRSLHVLLGLVVFIKPLKVGAGWFVC